MFLSYSEKLKRPDVRSQLQRTTKDQWFQCDICGEEEKTVWFSETDLEVHRKLSHFNHIMEQMSTYSSRFCCVCMTVQESPEALLEHIKSRHLFSSPNARRVERELFICDYCNHVFFNKDVMEIHIMYMHLCSPDDKKNKFIICPKCERQVLMKSLWYHLQYHEIPSLSVCDICLKHCDSVSDLLAHVREHPMYYKCDICNFHTNKDYIFESHLVRHRHTSMSKGLNKSVKRKALKFALKKESTANVLKYNIHHAFKGLLLPNFMHICVLCREICNSKPEITDHILRDHSDMSQSEGRPTYRCLCGAHFHTRVLLKHHVFKLKGSHGEAEATASSCNSCSAGASTQLEENEQNSTGFSETEIPVTFENQAMEVPVEFDNQGAKIPGDSSNQESESQEYEVPIESGSERIEVPADSHSPTSKQDDDSQIVYVYADVEEEPVDKPSEQVLGF